MKIFYAVQATGNGHIARAKELIPYLQKFGTVDVFLSGNNSNLNVPLPVKYKSKGVSLFYGKRGGLDYVNMFKEFSLYRIIKEARALPVEKYDMVVNDFESITSLACKLKNIPSVGFGHQASFKSPNAPRPDKKDWMGELILQQYASSSKYIGLHFSPYDDFIYSPIIKEAVLNATSRNEGHVTVYLSHYSDEIIAAALKKIPGQRFQVFSKKVKSTVQDGNIFFMPIDNDLFTNSMITSTGVITGAGFETPAEALVLGKKLMCLPIKGQYEQLCNAAALKNYLVPIISTIDHSFTHQVNEWLNTSSSFQLNITHSTQEIINTVVETALSLKESKYSSESNFGEDLFNFQPLSIKYQ